MTANCSFHQFNSDNALVYAISTQDFRGYGICYPPKYAGGPMNVGFTTDVGYPSPDLQNAFEDYFLDLPFNSFKNPPGRFNLRY